jgi:VCBS repeat-containing protein
MLAIIDLNEFAPVLNDAAFSVAENATNGTLVGTVTATDADATHGGFSYAIAAGNALGIFALDDSGRITVADKTNLDRESVSQVVLTVQVSDNGPGTAQTDTATVTIAVTDENEFAPVLNDAAFAVAENAANETLVGTVAATDTDATKGGLSYAITAGNALGIFAVDHSGQITVAGRTNLDRESVSQVVLTVQTSDNGPGTAKTDTATVTISVTDENEFAPVLNDAAFSVAENAANGTVVGTLAATDADATHGGFSYTITAGNALGIFAVDDSGRITVADTTNLNRESVSEVVLTVQVSDNVPGESLTDTAQVAIAIEHLNHPPQVVQPIPDQQATENFTFAFTVAAGTFADPDSGDPLTYDARLSSGEALPGWLSFDTATRRFSGTPPFDANATDDPLLVAVIATDSENLTAQATLTLLVRENPRPWQNPLDPLDVLPDGGVNPADALAGINFVNANGSIELPSPPSPLGPPPYLDVDGDGWIRPQDVLALINYLNGQSAGGEGEARAAERQDIVDTVLGGSAGLLSWSEGPAILRMGDALSASRPAPDAVRDPHGEREDYFLEPQEPLATLWAAEREDEKTQDEHCDGLFAALVDEVFADTAGLWSGTQLP